MTSLAELPEQCDILIVGGGPAGLAAATEAMSLGLSTVLVDENPAPGGQIYRAGDASPMRGDVLGPDFAHGRTLTAAFADSGATYLPGAIVWSLSAEREIGISAAGVSRIVTAGHVILATGALERPFPIAGWTLPGVMTCGAAQILLKTAGVAPKTGAVLAGTGPLLYLLAWQYLRAGVSIRALLDTTPRENRMQAARHLPAFLASAYARKGLGLLWDVRRKLRVIGGVTALRAEGDEHLREVAYRQGDGAETRIEAEHLFLHQGVAPNVNLPAAAGCTLVWDDLLLCFKPEADAWGASSLPGVTIAGDGAGIAGALAAEHRGRIGALHAAFALGRIDASTRDRRATTHRAALAVAERGRAFLDHLYQPAKSFRLPAEDAVVCRCEEVGTKDVRDAIALGCMGPNQLKSFTRCGMGPCQGRFCGLTVTEMMAEARGVSPAEIGYYRLRPPVKPITLGELAAMPQDAASLAAVVRG
ncbi:MAG TPA: NAD(P)/FAD-dependent oxidoreductase [Acetobacteraceae bacterium]